MDDVRIEIRVDNRGVLRPTRLDNDATGPEFRIRTSGLDADLIRLFEGWLRLRDRVWREVEIRSFGSLLHRFLFGERDTWDWIDSVIREVDPAVAHLQLVFPADGEYARLAAIPWEYLYRPEKQAEAGAYLAAQRNLILSRYIPRTAGEPLVPAEDELLVLVVVSQPDDPLLGEVLDEEVCKQIEQTVTVLNWKHDVLRDPTAEDLHEKLFDEPIPDVVHFMGHGQFDPERGEASLALIDPRGGTDWVADRRLAGLMTRGGRAPRAVVLHACEGGVANFPLSFAGVAPQLARNGVANVVAMQYEITNDTAIRFSTSLYRSIAAGVDLDAAVQEARWQIVSFSDDPRLVGLPVMYRQSACALFTPGRT
jgi:CHAT domain-containing protein